MNEQERFPILADAEVKWVPWRLMAAHEQQAIANHYQSLKKLASRGGLSPSEACAVIEDRRWHPMEEHGAREQLKAHVAIYIETAT